jgi:hypothetical protein
LSLAGIAAWGFSEADAADAHAALNDGDPAPLFRRHDFVVRRSKRASSSLETRTSCNL